MAQITQVSILRASGDHCRVRHSHFSRGCRFYWLLALLLSFASPTSTLTAAEPAASSTSTVNRDAIQILRSECFGCHNPEKKKGGLILTTREGLLKGSQEGPVVVLGKPQESLLLRTVISDADPHMPPKGQLTDAQIGVLKTWVQNEAPWDSTLAAAELKPKSIVLAQLPVSYHPTFSLAASPDGKRLASSQGGRIILYDLTQTNFPILISQQAHSDAIQSLAWSPDSKHLASGAFRQVRLWAAESLQPEARWESDWVGRVTSLVFDLKGETLFAADGATGLGGWIRRVSVSRPTEPIQSFLAHQDVVYGMVLSQDGLRLGTAGGDRLIKVWEPTQGKEIAVLEGHTAQVTTLAFNTNATQIASGGADRELKVWDIATKEKMISLGSHPTAVSQVYWLGPEQTLLVAREDGVVLRYTDLKSHTGEQSSATGQEHRIGDLGDEPVFALAAVPGTNIVFAAGQSGVVKAWTLEGKFILSLPQPAPARVAETQPIALREIDRPDVAAKSRSHPPSARAREAANEVESAVLGLSVSPSELRLKASDQVHGIQVTARGERGLEWDVTQQARFSASPQAPFRVELYGRLRGVRPGRGILTAQFGGHQVDIPIRVEGNQNQSTDRQPVTFVNDVLPALSRAGCSAGSCHAKPEGQNGFRLSVFSYDPKTDYHEIVKESRGRRVFPAAPDESLLIQKPMGLIPHEGGKRFEPGSNLHQLLTRWIKEGLTYSTPQEPTLLGISVFPKERRYRKAGAQQLLVQAKYSDGSLRDVTSLAGFASNDKEIARVDDFGLVRLGVLSGQGVVVARYMGFVSDSQVLIPAERLLPESMYAELPRNNFIDDLAHAQFRRLGLLPSEICTDAEFLRRVKLDAIGMLPTPDEVREFLSDVSADKRQRLMDRVLADPAYVDYWANKWADLLRPNPDRVGVKSVFTLDQWLRESFAKNQHYDDFVREILLAEGGNHKDGPAVIYRDRREPADLTTMFSQLFLGTRLECARCHHHPNEKWGQEDFYQFAAFFGPLKQKGAGLSPPISAGMETFYFSPGGGVKHPITGEIMKPRPPDGPATQSLESVDPRLSLVNWLTTRDNPFFARAAVNRVWSVFFGRGLVEPADDFRISNPCVNPALLDALAEDFAQHGFDLKHVMRRIMQSRLYQLSTTPNEFNMADTRNFSRAYRRRLPAEVMVDAVSDATGVPESFAALPIGSRATQAWSYKIDSHFMDAFGRPNASSDCPCERDTQLSVVQSLHLMNSKGLQAKLAHPKGRVAQLVSGNGTPTDIVRELYLLTLSRMPDVTEEKRSVEVFAAPSATRQTATEDVFWALLNSAEFVFNH